MVLECRTLRHYIYNCMMNTKAYIQLLCMMKRTGSKLTDVTKVNTCMCTFVYTILLP